MPSWLGKSAATGSLASFAGANPFKFLRDLAKMNDLEQRIYLEVIGEGLKVRARLLMQSSHGILSLRTCERNLGRFISCIATVDVHTACMGSSGGNAAAQVQLNSTCNPFGGEGACQQLPNDSKFAAVCKEHDLKVIFWRPLSVAHFGCLL